MSERAARFVFVLPIAAAVLAACAAAFCAWIGA
jgi:hypothetical protein